MGCALCNLLYNRNMQLSGWGASECAVDIFLMRAGDETIVVIRYHATLSVSLHSN